MVRKSRNASKEVSLSIVNIENFLRDSLNELGFSLGKRRYFKRENTFWFWVSKKGPFHLPTIMLDIIDPGNEIKLELLEEGLPEENIIKCLIEKYQELTGNFLTVRTRLAIF